MIESNPSIHIYNLLRQWKLQTEPIPKKCCHTVSNFNTQLTRKNPRVMSSSQKLPDSDPDKISKRSTKIQNLRSWNSEETTSTTWCDLILPSVFFRVGGVNHGKMLVVKNWRNKPRISPVLGGIVPANMLPGGGELGNLTTKPFQQFQGCWTVYGDKQRCIAVDVGLRQAMQKPEERLLNVRLFFPLWN